MTFAQRRTRLTAHISERIPAVKRRISVQLYPCGIHQHGYVTADLFSGLLCVIIHNHLTDQHKAVPVHAMKAYRGSRGTAPFIPNLGATCE
jgi:hypothetical protein